MRPPHPATVAEVGSQRVYVFDVLLEPLLRAIGILWRGRDEEARWRRITARRRR